MQEDVQNRVRAGARRALADQARIGERIAITSEALEELERRVGRNDLDDPMLEEMLMQAQDLLREAGQASAQAVTTAPSCTDSPAFLASSFPCWILCTHIEHFSITPRALTVTSGLSTRRVRLSEAGLKFWNFAWPL